MPSNEDVEPLLLFISSAHSAKSSQRMFIRWRSRPFRRLSPSPALFIYDMTHV
jgi:hypothetical protein